MAYGASKDESVQCHLCDLLRVTELLVLYVVQVILMENQRMHHRLLWRTFSLGSL